jgi:hypothetical protein
MSHSDWLEHRKQTVDTFRCKARDEEHARDIWAQDCPGGEIISVNQLAVDDETLHQFVIEYRKGDVDTYKVTLIETVTYTVQVEAQNDIEAEQLAVEAWCQSENPTEEFNGIGEGTIASDVTLVEEE